MTKVNEWNQAEGYPSIQMGIGIHTGDAIVGCIGSETRMKYDVIGRNMNLASRAEGFTKGGQILVTDETLAAAGEDVHENLSGMLHVSPKGIANFVNLHDVIGIGNLRIPGV
jgi:adenylate cyclase